MCLSYPRFSTWVGVIPGTDLDTKIRYPVIICMHPVKLVLLIAEARFPKKKKKDAFPASTCGKIDRHYLVLTRSAVFLYLPTPSFLVAAMTSERYV